MIKHYGSKQLENERDNFTSVLHSITKGSQGRNLESGTEAEAMGE